MIDQFVRTKDKVKHLLTQKKILRDSDKLLWLAYLCTFKQLHKRLGPAAYSEFRLCILDEDTAPMESVRRMRQKIQEETPALRGELYEERQRRGGECHDYFAGGGNGDHPN